MPSTTKFHVGFVRVYLQYRRLFFLCQVVIDTKSVLVEFASVQAIECLSKDRYYAFKWLTRAHRLLWKWERASWLGKPQIMPLSIVLPHVLMAYILPVQIVLNCSDDIRRENFEIEFRHFGLWVCLTRSQHFRTEGVHWWQKKYIIETKLHPLGKETPDLRLGQPYFKEWCLLAWKSFKNSSINGMFSFHQKIISC